MQHHESLYISQFHPLALPSQGDRQLMYVDTSEFDVRYEKLGVKHISGFYSDPDSE